MTDRARIIDEFGNVEEVSRAEAFERIFGHPPRTKEQRAADWQAKCERWADAIELGNEVFVPPPCLRDARRIVAEREAALTELLPENRDKWVA